MGNNKNNMKKIKRALISVWDKNNLSNLINCLKKHKIEIVSSGGTYKKIRNLGFKCLEISSCDFFELIAIGCDTYILKLYFCNLSI